MLIKKNASPNLGFLPSFGEFCEYDTSPNLGFLSSFGEVCIVCFILQNHLQFKHNGKLGDVGGVAVCEPPNCVYTEKLENVF